MSGVEKRSFDDASPMDTVMCEFGHSNKTTVIDTLTKLNLLILLSGEKMGAIHDPNFDSCPNCNTVLFGPYSRGHMTNDNCCSICNIPLKLQFMTFCEPKEAPYDASIILVDHDRIEKWRKR